jgi:hypothetical protein
MFSAQCIKRRESQPSFAFPQASFDDGLFSDYMLVSDDSAENQTSSTPKTTRMFRLTGEHPFCFATGSRGFSPGWAMPRAGNHYSIEFFILAETAII